MKYVMERFVQPDKVSCQVDVSVDKNLLSYKDIDIGFATRAEVRKCKSVKDVDIASFRIACKRGLTKIVTKLMERSPLKFRLTKAISCLDPTIEPDERNKRMVNLLEILMQNAWLDSKSAEAAKRQFRELCSSNLANELKNFDRKKNRLDTFWMKFFNNHGSEYGALISVLKLVLTLSHGNANVERGFSINGECVIDNMKEETVVGCRLTYDSIAAEGGVDKVEISKSLIHAARNSHATYRNVQETRKKVADEEDSKQSSRKRNHALVRELETKRAKVLEDARQRAEHIDEEISNLKK